MSDHLTPAGWPRPIVDGWPVPWISPASDLSFVDADRKAAVIETHLCQVCGLPHEPGTRVFMFLHATVPPGAPPETPNLALVAIDEAVMHERCARLAAARCPRLKQMRADGDFLCYSADAEDVETVEAVEDDTKHLGVRVERIRVEEDWP